MRNINDNMSNEPDILVDFYKNPKKSPRAIKENENVLLAQRTLYVNMDLRDDIGWPTRSCRLGDSGHLADECTRSKLHLE